jgi:phosphate-selective porin OprO/OprP
LILIWIVLIVASLLTSAQEAGKILIRNARLIDRDGQTEDHNVSILIKETKLFIVTMDEVDLEEGMTAYDAGNGVLLGTLDIGKQASFLIVDKDPSEEIEVLLDTKKHVTFAIRQGVIKVNHLLDVGSPVTETSEKKIPRWIAYSPPPMALPLTYQDQAKWNRWDTRYFSGIFVAAAALDRQRWLTQDGNSLEQVGELKDYDGGEIRAFRMGIAGTLNFKKPWFYTFMIASHAFDKGFNSKASDQITILDYRLDIPFSKYFAISLGKQKEPISMERLLLGTQLQMQERPSGVDALFTFRNVGIRVNGTALEQRVAWAGGVFNDWFDEGQRFNESANQVIGRISGLPYANRDESHLLHLGLGVRYTDAREGIRYGASPEFNQAPIYVFTDSLEANFALTYDLEVSWRRGPFWISAEFLRNKIEAPQLNNPVFGGFHVSGSWILTREMRSYNKRNGTFGAVPVSRSVYQGGPGAWEIAARYSSLSLSDGLVDGGEMDIFSLGVNWWLTPTFGVNINYRYIMLNRYGIRGRSSGIMYRLLLMLE